MEQVLGGRYRIERLVGRGGVTDVYEATDLTLDRRVAMKVLKEELDEEPAVRHLFEDAARRSAVLSHPNIVSTFDFGDDDGISFVVSEFMDEPTLAEVLADGPLPPRRVAEVGVDMAAALSDAHAHGIMHRGPKPQDVFVDPEGEARMSDFGVTGAAERARNLDREARMVEARYVSPDRAQGRPADPRTDLYGLGLVLYEAATGRPAAMGSSPAELAAQHLEQYPPRPREVNPDIPAELEAVLARLLAKNPEARLPSADVVHQQLQELLDSGVLGAATGVPAGAPPPPPPPVPPRNAYDEEFFETEEPIATAAAAAAAGQGQIVRIGANDSTTVLPSPPPYRYDERRRRPPLVLWAGLGAVALVIILIAVALSRGGGGGTTTLAVPDVVNKTQDEAVAALTRAGFKANPVSLPNDTVAAGIVYAQDPPKGRKVARGSTINLSVSSGPVESSTTSEPPTTVPPLSTPTTARRTTTTRRQVTTTRPRVTTTARTVPRTTVPTTPPTSSPPSSSPPST